MQKYEQLIELAANGSIVDGNLLNNLNNQERNLAEEIINKKISEGNINFYQFIPFLNEITDHELMSTKHVSNLSEENWFELAKNMYLRRPSHEILDYIYEKAHTSLPAFNSLVEISKKRPDITDLPQLIEDIKKNALFDISPKKMSDQAFDENIYKGDGKIIYIKMDSGITIKVDKEEHTAYRLNEEKKEWQEDLTLYTDYSYGNVFGKAIQMTDTFPIGEPYDYRRSL